MTLTFITFLASSNAEFLVTDMVRPTELLLFAQNQVKYCVIRPLPLSALPFA